MLQSLRVMLICIYVESIRRRYTKNGGKMGGRGKIKKKKGEEKYQGKILVKAPIIKIYSTSLTRISMYISSEALNNMILVYTC